jgi:threonine dehydrogenase-like Zn-dependent dehydrogenase
MTLAVQYQRSPLKYLTARSATATRLGARFSGPVVSNLAPLRLVHDGGPELPGPGWVRLRPRLSGICGSDLGLLTGRSSPYLSPMVSMPFVPGHEIVAEILDPLPARPGYDGRPGQPALPAGSRVVVDPVLSCAVRGEPPCAGCLLGRQCRCDRITTGALAPGLQTGFCADTGGGWSRAMVAHASQLHAVPDELVDERAVLVEPLACAIHSVRRVPVMPGAPVLVVGAGTVGLLTVLALRRFTDAGPIFVVAKYPHQRARAQALGATEVLEPTRVARALRRITGGALEKPNFGAEFLLGGVEMAFECTGGASGIDTALRLVRAGGTVLLSGVPSGSVDLTPVWFRELVLVGSYASDAGGPATVDGGADRSGDFAAAIALAVEAPLSGYVDAVYPLSRWRDAVGHAAAAGRLGAVKVAFDPSRD